MSEKDAKKGAAIKPNETPPAAPESATPILDAGARLVTGVLGTVFRTGDRVLVAAADEANKAGHAIVDGVEREVKKVVKEP